MRRRDEILLTLLLSSATLVVSCGTSDPTGSDPTGGSDVRTCSSPADRARPAAGDKLSVAAVQGLAGLCLADAEAWAQANGFRARVAERDGESLDVTADYSESRVNVAMADGKIIRVMNIGY